jgi:hypothetical protein
MALGSLPPPADKSRMSLQDTPFVKRLAITLTLGCAFIMMASIFTPERSRAGNAPQRAGRDNARVIEPRPREHAEAMVSADAHAGLKSLGVIESGQYSLAIFSTDLGARYTIVRTETGEELGTLLTAEQVQQLLPEVELKSLDFSAPTDLQPLMLAEPRQ